jgi:integrase
MSSVSIRRREAKSGIRHQVRYRLGGRFYPLVHAGSFKTQKEARLRRDLVAGELAAGRDPTMALQALTRPAEPTRTLAEVAARFQASRVHLSSNAAKSEKTHLARILPVLGGMAPHTISPGDVQAWIAANTKTDENKGGLAPSSLVKYHQTLCQLLDFAGIEPNPARNKHVRLPRVEVDEVDPPTAKQTLAILERVGRRWLLPLICVEQTAMRPGEPVKLVWGDVDVAESRFRLPRRSTKSRRPRWVQVPCWLMEHVAATCPLEDRTAGRRVFPDYKLDGAEYAMGVACKAAGIPHFTPHQLRHRRLTRWHHDGVPVKVLAERAGHGDATLTLNLYSHVLDPKEVPQESLEALLVWPGCGLEGSE